MYVNDPTAQQLAGLLEHFEGRSVEVEVVSRNHVSIVNLQGEFAGMAGTDGIKVSRSGRGDEPDTDVNLPGVCRSVWARLDFLVLHLEFEDGFIHIWDPEIVAEEAARNVVLLD